MKLIKISIMALMVFSIASCGEGKYGGMSNSELAKKERHCDSIPKKSAVFANGCEKVAEEIKKRRKQKK